MLYYFCVVLNQLLNTFRRDPLGLLHLLLAGLNSSQFVFGNVLLQAVTGFKGYFWVLLCPLEELYEMDFCVSTLFLCISLVFFVGFVLMSVCD